jgi:hypothetical protein
MSPKIPMPRSIDPGSRPRNPGEISRTRIQVELMTTAQGTVELDGKGVNPSGQSVLLKSVGTLHFSHLPLWIREVAPP